MAAITRNPILRVHAIVRGNGYIAGTSPGLLTVNGSVAAREIEVRVRTTRLILETKFSASDGTYRFNNLDTTLVYDVIARDWQGVYNDVIRANITPMT